jgi:hypothetical protein
MTKSGRSVLKKRLKPQDFSASLRFGRNDKDGASEGMTRWECLIKDIKGKSGDKNFFRGVL